MNYQQQQEKFGYNLGALKGLEEGNLLLIRTYSENEGWKEIRKRASENATYKQLNEAQKLLAQKLRKSKINWSIDVWFNSECKSKLFCKAWSN